MWYNFHYNTGTGTGQTVYQFVPKDAVVGVVEKGVDVKGLIEEPTWVLGSIEIPAEVYGQTVSDKTVEGKLELNELKGKELCP